MKCFDEDKIIDKDKIIDEDKRINDKKRKAIQNEGRLAEMPDK